MALSKTLWQNPLLFLYTGCLKGIPKSDDNSTYIQILGSTSITVYNVQTIILKVKSYFDHCNQPFDNQPTIISPAVSSSPRPWLLFWADGRAIAVPAESHEEEVDGLRRKVEVSIPQIEAGSQNWMDICIENDVYMYIYKYTHTVCMYNMYIYIYIQHI